MQYCAIAWWWTNFRVNKKKRNRFHGPPDQVVYQFQHGKLLAIVLSRNQASEQITFWQFNIAMEAMADWFRLVTCWTRWLTTNSFISRYRRNLNMLIKPLSYSHCIAFQSLDHRFGPCVWLLLMSNFITTIYPQCPHYIPAPILLKGTWRWYFMNYPWANHSYTHRHYVSKRLNHH